MISMLNLIIDPKSLKIIYLLDFSMIKIFGDLYFSKIKKKNPQTKKLLLTLTPWKESYDQPR